MTKHFVLDTNVIISNPKVFLSFKKEETLVIPYCVIIEMERHKLSMDELGTAARESSRQLMKIIEGHKEQTLKAGITLDNESCLMISSARVDHPEVLEKVKSYPVPSPDDEILATCVGLKESGLEVMLLSEDSLLKIRANGFDIPSRAGMDDGTTSSAVEELHPGCFRVEVDDVTISEYWEEFSGKEEFFNPREGESLNKLQAIVSARGINPNDFLILNYTKKKPHAILRAYKKKGHEGLMFKFVPEHKLNKLKPLNIEQQMALDLLMDHTVPLVTLVGQSGTGKSLVSIAAGLEQVLNEKIYKTLIIIRPVYPVGRDIGFLPGSKEEKLDPWLSPIKDNLRHLIGGKKTGHQHGNNGRPAEGSLDHFIERGIIEIEAATFIRGRSIDNAFMLIDECQNFSRHELKTILTRVGHNTKIVLTGDIEQMDRTDISAATNGITIAVEKFKKYSLAGHVTLKDGVRSELSALAAKIL